MAGPILFYLVGKRARKFFLSNNQLKGTGVREVFVCLQEQLNGHKGKDQAGAWRLFAPSLHL